MVSNTLQDFKTSRNLEWLETNGLGGYASSTVSGAHSRRYHGLLVAATDPPVGRMVVVSKLDEAIVANDQRWELGANQYPGAVHPQGFRSLRSFERDLFPVFYYETGGVTLKKTIAAIHGEHTTVILYEVITAPTAFDLELLPLYACRDFHSLSHANDAIGQHYLFRNGIFQTLNYQGCPECFIAAPGATFTENKAWYYNFEYHLEQERGLEHREDLYTHGKFSVRLKHGDQLGVILSTEDPTGKDAFELFHLEKTRREQVVKDFSRGNDRIKQLALAADQFIVKRGDLKTIVAGYPWFSDWGRDTMISLPGLCLVTRRFDDAKNILKVFASHMDQGMLPNRFPDHGDVPEYNTMDATLWFFQAVYRYYEYTRDLKFVKELLPALQDSIAGHYKGTRYNIHVDPADELLYGGEDGVQLTWMDAKVGNWVVTPRKGKPVEINALWYNTLCIMEFLLTETGNGGEASSYKTRAAKVRTKFNDLFWNEEQHCLYDYLDGDYRNDDIRPNQLFAVSLPFPLLDKNRAASVFEIVAKYLLTPRGLRSLAPLHKDYKPVYSGGIIERDGAYHQGTVWSFLLGPYIDALLVVKGDEGKPEASRILNEFYEHLDEACVGTVSEIFDADLPYMPRGAAAQGWGVAEVLRVSVGIAKGRKPGVRSKKSE
jgi:predicted glycogen debranching enzyme